MQVAGETGKTSTVTSVICELAKIVPIGNVVNHAKTGFVERATVVEGNGVKNAKSGSVEEETAIGESSSARAAV